MSTIRIAILVCDPLLPTICAKYGSYGGVVTAFLTAGMQRLGLPASCLALTIWDVENSFQYPEPDSIDAVIITGSRLSAYDDVPWIQALMDYIKQILSHGNVKIIGLCFGHQLVGRVLGAESGKNSSGYEMSVCNVSLSPLGSKVFGKSEIAVHQMHHDIVFSYPAGVAPLGSSSVCEVQGMFRNRKLFTLQGHPEFNGEIMCKLLEASDNLGFEDRTLWKDAMNRVSYEHDGVLVAATILRFIRDDSEFDSLNELEVGQDIYLKE